MRQQCIVFRTVSIIQGLVALYQIVNSRLMVQQGLPRSGTPPAFPRRRGLPEKRKIRDVKKVVAVSSAKGGVGKSTVAGGLKAFLFLCLYLRLINLPQYEHPLIASTPFISIWEMDKSGQN